MSGNDNINTIKAVYEAFGRGDVGFIADCVTGDVDWATESTSDGAPWYGKHEGKQGVGEFFEQFGKACEVEDFTPLAFAATDDGDVLTVVRFATPCAGNRQDREDASAPLLPVHQREDLVLPGQRGHGDHRGRTALTPPAPPAVRT